MSFILDALKKAEAEKAAGQPQPLEQQIAAHIPPPAQSYRSEQEQAQRRTLALILGGILGLGLLAFAGYKLWPKPTTAIAAQGSQKQPVTVADTASQDLPTAVTEPTTPQVTEADNSDGKQQAAEAEIYVAAENIPVKPEDAGAEAGNMDDLIGDEDAIDEAAPPEAEPQPTAAEVAALSKPVKPGSESRKAKATERAGIKRLRDMPPTFRSGFPPLTVEVHYYDDNPLRRFVIINGKKYRETDSLLEGPRVVEITVDGVILDQGGTQVVKGLPR